MSIRLLLRRHRATTLLALLLLVLRLAVPSYAMSAGAMSAGTAGEDAVLARMLGEVPICHADAGPAAPGPAGEPAIPSAHDCLLCPLCQLAGPALLPAAAGMAHPLAARTRTAGPPPSTGPPQPRRYSAARPRGPPASAV